MTIDTRTSEASPLVSIIIPCYNAEEFVAEAIESALRQSYPNVEVIVIDDGSTDDSLEVIRSFGERVRWWSGENKGASTARNHGISMAKGTLIQFLDSDDLLKPEKIAEQLPLVIRFPGSVVYSDYDNIDHDGNPVSGLSAPVGIRTDPVCFILDNIGLQTSAPVHWKDRLLAVGGFGSELSCAQERDLHLRLACAGMGFVHLPKSLFVVRQTADSLSSDYVKVLDQHESIATTAHAILMETGKLTDGRRAALAAFLARDARSYLQRGFPKRAEHYFQFAKDIHPKGGLDAAYRPATRMLRKVLGAVLVERLVSIKRYGRTTVRIV